jgi:hypothetical protein
MRIEKMVAEAWDCSGTQMKGLRLEVSTKKRLVRLRVFSLCYNFSNLLVTQ